MPDDGMWSGLQKYASINFPFNCALLYICYEKVPPKTIIWTN